MKYKCLSIAGFDNSGGAGMQADIKTFSATGVYALTVLTAIPIQNTCGVRSCYSLSLSCIEEQFEVVFDDIKPDAIKIGMLFSNEIIELISFLLQKKAQNIPIVLDPVMIAKSGDVLLKKDAICALKTKLLPITNILTPNLPEARELVAKQEDKQVLAQRLLDLGCEAVLLKGGHDASVYSNDLYVSQHCSATLLAQRINSTNTHGTGRTLSAAIASFLAQGFSYLDACKKAKSYLYKAIMYSKDFSLGKGNGPVHHFYQLDDYLSEKIT
jgi:hydroxymethylpyrimidine/phosphomethylpyrimidine kinase